ncbi:MAG: TrlF family AAA-like ATPase [Terriglobia bacterium]
MTSGSEWRKWDLHVHSPMSALNNQFPKLQGGQPDWDRYFNQLRTLTDIAVLGITDYFSIEGYQKVREVWLSGRLPNIQLVLPNIELRLGTFVRGSGTDRRVNYHVIFSDEVSPQDIDDHFLGQLRFTYDSSPDGEHADWPLNRANLERLGATLKAQESSFTGSDYEVGCKTATVDAGALKKLLDEKASIFRGKYLLLVENLSESDMPWQGQDHQTRKILLKGAHAIFSANAGTIAWARGEGDLSADQFINEFKSLKPCFHGSDAHHLEKICKPAQDRYCWIKADPTFEGLKQVLYEPRERVFVGNTPPKLKNDYQIIKSVKVVGQGWFPDEEIPLNRDLVAVIGGRGSGKSALGEVIAFAAGSKIFRGTEDISDSFLSKASRKSFVNTTPILGARVTIKWNQGPSSEVIIPAGLKHSLEDEKVEYLPQKFVERLCAPENTEKLEEQIEHVIFQRIDKSERLGASGFRELRNASTQPIQLKKSQAKKAIQSLNQSISSASTRIALKAQKIRDESLRRAELETLLKNIPQSPIQIADEVKQREALIKAREQLQNDVSALNAQLTAINTIESRLEIMRSDLADFNEDMSALLDTAGLGTQKDRFKLAVPPELSGLLVTKRREIGEAIRVKKEGRPEQPDLASLNSLESAIRQLDQKSQLTEASKREHDKFQKDKRTLEDAIASLQKEIKEIDDLYIPRRDKDQKTRLQKYTEHFDLLKEEQRQLEALYKPLQDALLSSNETARRLEFVSKITFNIPGHAINGYDLVDRRKVLREENSLEIALRDFFVSIEQDGFSQARVADSVKILWETILSAPEYGSIQEILRKEKRSLEFADWFFNTDPFSVSYSIKYDGKDLQFLSPGEKGIVLLLLYLEAEQDDNRPLIIDQPDDNLDNLSVYPSLVEYFRKRKKTRQIIIITHNPNLVVNTDAEEVIVANFDGSRDPKIKYRSGALENTIASGGTGIREDVCKILEGGTEAFQRRERKYSLPEV